MESSRMWRPGDLYHGSGERSSLEAENRPEPQVAVSCWATRARGVALHPPACAGAFPNHRAFPLAVRLFYGMFLEPKENRVFENRHQTLPKQPAPLTRAGGRCAFPAHAHAQEPWGARPAGQGRLRPGQGRPGSGTCQGTTLGRAACRPHKAAHSLRDSWLPAWAERWKVCILAKQGRGSGR